MEMTNDTVCLRCSGTGRQAWDEDGRRFVDRCYACLGLGYVSEEENFSQKLSNAVDTLAGEQAMDYRRVCDSDPDGDGFGLIAAENGLTTGEYQEVLVSQFSAQIEREVVGWTQERQEWFVALSTWPNRVEGLSSDPVAFLSGVPVPEIVAEEEIPF